MKVSFKVTFKLPPFASKREALAYMYDAVGTMKGCYRPMDDESGEGDPMSELDPSTLKISFVRKAKKKS